MDLEIADYEQTVLGLALRGYIYVFCYIQEAQQSNMMDLEIADYEQTVLGLGLALRGYSYEFVIYRRPSRVT